MTAQVTEVLRYRNEEYPLCTEPLELFLAQNKRIQFDSPHTACWRGYIGTWEIKGSVATGYGLYLVELLGYKDGRAHATLKDIFPEAPHGVFAHWFSGTLRCTVGNLLEYMHMGYGSTYEKDLLIEIQQGMYVSEKLINNVLE
jgi:hypothetical protein